MSESRLLTDEEYQSWKEWLEANPVDTEEETEKMAERFPPNTEAGREFWQKLLEVKARMQEEEQAEESRSLIERWAEDECGFGLAEE